jgi:hypothetical protein
VTAADVINATAVVIPSGTNSGRVLISGGLVNNAASPTAATAQYLSDTTGNTFTAVGSLAHARADHAAALLASGKVLICGGTNGTSPINTCELFDPSNTGTIEGTGSMVQPRKDFGMVPMSVFGASDIFAGGGNANSNNLCEVYDPD